MNPRHLALGPLHPPFWGTVRYSEPPSLVGSGANSENLRPIKQALIICARGLLYQRKYLLLHGRLSDLVSQRLNLLQFDDLTSRPYAIEAIQKVIEYHFLAND
jgi:hypothetical protein